MKFKCINCGKEWGRGNPEKDGYSHGVCKKCLKLGLTEIYRKRQVEEGSFDCFAKSSGYCDRLDCKYRELCLYMEERDESNED